MNAEYLENENMQEPDKKPSNQFDNQLVYMNNALAKHLKFENIQQEQLFAMALSQLDFYATEDTDFEIIIGVKDVREKLGLAPDEDFYSELRDRYKRVRKHTEVEFELENEDHDWIIGNLISSVRSNKGKGTITVSFEKKFKKALQFCKAQYMKIPLDEIVEYGSQYPLKLQRHLTMMYKVGKEYARVQNFIFSTKQLKELFGLSETDYCKKDGHFDRYNFEKKTIKRAVDEINEKSQVMAIEWKKERIKGNIYYRFYVTIATKIKRTPPVLDHVDPDQMSIDEFY